MDTSPRIAWVDHAKALGILLVVLGHTAGLPDFAMKLIYSFHMPLFFFLSGSLLKETYLQLPLTGYLKRLWRTLLLPYIGFWVLSYLYWLATHSLVLDPSKYAGLTFFDLLSGFLHGTGDLSHTLYIINVDLWFFTCLFSTALFFYLIRRVTAGKWLVGILALLGILGPLLPGLLGRRLPWNIELAGAALVFYGTGYLLRSRRLPSKSISLWTSALALPAWVGIVWLNGGIDMNTMQFGRLWLFYAGAAMGVYLTVAGAQYIPENHLTRWLSQNTIVIFPLHQLMFSVFTGIGVRLLGFPATFKTSLAASLAFTILALACSLPAVYLLRRFAPFMIGERVIDPKQA
jgi:acyltransferase